MTFRAATGFLLALLGAGLAGAPAAAGELLADLRKVDAGGIDTRIWHIDQHREQIYLVCQSCIGLTMVRLTIRPDSKKTGRKLRDGTYDRKALLEQCRDNADTHPESRCYDLQMFKLKGAPGFVGYVKVAKFTFSTTYRLYTDGKLLSVESKAPSLVQAKLNGMMAIRKLANQIIR